jgi:DNA mismatch endonuclease (patch repair protein)
VKRIRSSRKVRPKVDPQLSEHMRKIRSTNTRPEIAARKAAQQLGARFRLHARKLPGRPDLVFPDQKKVIFVNGCFWHQHPGCKLRSTPQCNLQYWLPKFARTRARDRENRSALKKLGWKQLVLWECQTRDGSRLLNKVAAFLK